MTDEELNELARACSAFTTAFLRRAKDAPHETMNEGAAITLIIGVLRAAGKV